MNHVREWIQAFVAGELDQEKKSAVEKHLAECAECRAEADRSVDLWEVLASADTRLPLTASVWPSVQARTLGQLSGSRAWFFGKGPWMRAGLATAAVAAGLAVGVLVPAGSSEQARIDGEVSEASWLLDSSWLSGSSWLADFSAVGLDDILLGADLADEGNGS
jgi:predicted anti-sigma-YlaC factor YlaD